LSVTKVSHAKSKFGQVLGPNWLVGWSPLEQSFSQNG